MNDVTIRKAIKEDCNILLGLDYQNSIDKMFSISVEDNLISLSETNLSVVETNESSKYHTEIAEDFIPNIDKSDRIALVSCLNDKTVGWVLTTWKNRKAGKILVIDGILVANDARGKGCAKALVNRLIKIAKADPECIALRCEMDTKKYHACKLLLKSGFTFAGTELYVWSSNPPSKFSKEVLYFYYPLQR